MLTVDFLVGCLFRFTYIEISALNLVRGSAAPRPTCDQNPLSTKFKVADSGHTKTHINRDFMILLKFGI